MIKEAFIKYLDFGYQPMLLHYGTKVPIFFKWQKNYNHNNYLPLLDNGKKYNIGLLLGKTVDIEGDSEEANEILNNNFMMINHPIYKSKKSYHHLFKNTFRNISRIQIGRIEIRGYCHQSVVPPSNVNSEKGYAWIEDLVHYNDLPEIPIEFAKFYNLPSLKRIVKEKARGEKLSVIWCSRCRKKKLLNESLISNILSKPEKWCCKPCRKIN